MTNLTFTDRRDAGEQLGRRLKAMSLHSPVVLAIPRGGIEVAAPIAAALNAELDVVLSRKLRAPEQPELAIGAIGEGGEVYLDPDMHTDPAYVEQERRAQLEEIDRRRGLFRAVRSKVPLAGRSVIIVDDGIATGATMIAAIRTARSDGAAEVIVAVPVGSPDRIASIRPLCDALVCLSEPEVFWAVGQFYRDFGQVSDERVVELLRARGRDGVRTPA